MKLVALYSSNPVLFPDIAFREGFNVVFAQVADPHADDKDSHNLGKTFLITVIDFVLLGGADRKHPLRKSPDLFGELTFYLEIKTPVGRYVTVRRSVTGSRAIAIEDREAPAGDLRGLPFNEWTHTKLGESSAREILDGLLDLAVIRPYGYRKGLSYFLRRQHDYDEVFRISKFGSGRDIDWKPFMALLLGLDHDLVKRKYDLDAKIDDEKEYLQRVLRESGTENEEYDAVQGQIEILSGRIERGRSEVNAFSFREVEEAVTQEVVDHIEAEISRLNELHYTLRYELGEVRRSLETGLSFDLDHVETIFEEAGLAFGEAVAKSYEDLVEFNHRLAEGRNRRLRGLQEDLDARIERVTIRLAGLDAERQRALALLTQRKTFQKYMSLQARLADQERELAALYSRLEYLNRAASVERQIRELRGDRAQLEELVRTMMMDPTPLYKSIRQTFATYADEVMNVPALLHVEVNQQGNLEFRTSTLENAATRRETSEGRGTSYLKMLCACFDLALLTVYADQPFYHFVYHDGVFEGLDDRRKVKLLGLVRQLCNNLGIQYILTVIDSDIPRDASGQRVLFEEDEIIRRLHDEGDEGRLFRAPVF